MKISIIIPAAENTVIKTKEIQKQTKKQLEFIIVRGDNPSKNRNLGVKKAKSKLIAFTNAHATISPDWVEKVRLFFRKYPQMDIVGGPQFNSPDEGKFGRISGYALSSVFGAGVVSKRYKSLPENLNVDETHLTSANLICRKSVFSKVQFDEKLYPGEDPKFISDAKKVGLNVGYSPDIIVYNERRNSVGELAKQVFNYGRFRPLKESLLSTLRHPSFMIPSFFLIYLLLLPTLLIVNFLLIIPLLVYLVLSIFFSAYESIKNKDLNSVFFLPLVFLIIHISYGAGFLYGSLLKKG